MSDKPFRIYTGYDKRDHWAWLVARHTLLKHATIPVEVIPLKDWELRARNVLFRPYRVEDNGQMVDHRDGLPFSTDFSYARFAVAMLENYGPEPVMFCDPDMHFRGDIAELKEIYDELDAVSPVAVACVKHDHRPREARKMTDNIQRVYDRKNWSSLMIMRPDRCQGLTKYAVNQMPRDWLHAMCWADDSMIEGLPEEWNWLAGWSDPSIDPKVVHFTRGTPDMPGCEDEAYADEWRAALEELKNGPGSGLFF